MKTEWMETSSSFKAMIIGKLLGDGCITVQKGRKPRFQFIHAATDYNWSNYCYQQLLDTLPLNPPKYKKNYDPRLTKRYSESYYVQSKTSPIITYLRSKWYTNSGKVIPFDLLNKYFNEQSLAWWYMDDGHLKQSGNIPQKIILSTESFTPYENKFLMDFLLKKYNLNFHLDKQNRIILYDQLQIYYFLYLVTPYLHTSMHRKLTNSFRFNFDLPAKRTTIYLPNTVKLTSPTKEINTALKQLDHVITSYKSDKFYEKYWVTLSNKDKTLKTKGYQIMLSGENISKMHFLNSSTGMQLSKIVLVCFNL